jgi:hypothetical protein
MMAAMATSRRADMFTADGKPSDDDPREHGPRLALNRHGSGGGPMSLREVLVGMIEEYARHMGHAGLLRERIDGRIGQ